MLNLKKMTLAFVTAVALTGFAGGTAQDASASAYSTVSSTSMTKTAYHKKSTSGAVYNASHTKVVAKLKSYPNTTWYATKKVTLKHNGKKAVYYKVKNGAGTKSGIVWHKYVVKGAAPFGLKYAKAAVAYDADSNKTVWSKNGNTARPIASVSKIMTLYLVQEKAAGSSGSWSSKVNTSYSGLKRMGLDSACGGFRFTKNSYTVKQLFDAALIDSSNNAAIALGQWVAGAQHQPPTKKFITMMNSQADEWGLKHTNFVSSSGLEQSDLRTFGYSIGGSDANMVSANDVAIIADHLITDFPSTLTTAKVKSMTLSGQTLYNYNNMLPGRKYYSASLNVDGLKTGYTPKAGYCFVGTGQKSGHNRIITVVLHDENEFTETKSIMNMAYNKNLL
ncbi:serine hydrolase [Secundilactobacillus oryzae]|uniref:serine hydrolase n=1 Tax=Secundilactobacillus oryzae TaxID=1202668 RepID=UPI0006D0EDB2|nr:serine hydrolase [Secundilactobacillus oryzae]